MTRKKFVKQLMAMGVSRNAANALAKHARNCGSYQTALQYERVRIAAQNIVDNIVHGIRTIVAPPLQDFADRFLNAWNNVTARFRWGVSAYELPRLYALDKEDALKPAREWPAQNPYLAHHGYVCGIDLANGPDFTAGGGGDG